jgi:hypothetical protein
VENGRDKCPHCNKLVFSLEKENYNDSIYHAQCVKKIKKSSNMSSSARGEHHQKSDLPIRPLTSRSEESTKNISLNLIPVAAQNDKVQDLKTKFLQEYEKYRSLSAIKLDDLKEQSNMDDEEFQANLETLVKQMQNGEIITPEMSKEEESPEKLIHAIFSKHKRQISQSRDKGLNNQSDPKIKVIDPNIPANTPEKLHNKKRTSTVISLEKFGRRTSEQMDKILSTKKNNPINLSYLDFKRPKVQLQLHISQTLPDINNKS